MSNSNSNECEHIDYYAQQKYAQLEKQIYYLQQQNAKVENLVNVYLQSKCINPTFSLINYTTKITSPRGLPPVQLGNITYYQTVISNSFNGDRIWTFTLGGDIYAPKFDIVYQFNPNCVVPNGYDFALLKYLNFYINNTSTEYEPLQGMVVVDNIGFPISDAPLVVSLTWDAETGVLIFSFDISRNTLAKYPTFATQAALIDQVKFGPTRPKSLFINLTIRDECNANSPCG